MECSIPTNNQRPESSLIASFAARLTDGSIFNNLQKKSYQLLKAIQENISSVRSEGSYNKEDEEKFQKISSAEQRVGEKSTVVEAMSKKEALKLKKDQKAKKISFNDFTQKQQAKRASELLQNRQRSKKRTQNSHFGFGFDNSVPNNQLNVSIEEPSYNISEDKEDDDLLNLSGISVHNKSGKRSQNHTSVNEQKHLEEIARKVFIGNKQNPSIQNVMPPIYPRKMIKTNEDELQSKGNDGQKIGIKATKRVLNSTKVQRMKKFDSIVEATFDRLIQETIASRNSSTMSRKNDEILPQKESDHKSYQSFIERNFGVLRNYSQIKQSHLGSNESPRKNNKIHELQKKAATTNQKELNIKKRKLYCFTEEIEERIHVKNALREIIVEDRQLKRIQKERAEEQRRRIEAQALERQKQIERKRQQQEEKLRKRQVEQNELASQQQHGGSASLNNNLANENTTTPNDDALNITRHQEFSSTAKQSFFEIPPKPQEKKEQPQSRVGENKEAQTTAVPTDSKLQQASEDKTDKESNKMRPLIVQMELSSVEGQKKEESKVTQKVVDNPFLSKSPRPANAQTQFEKLLQQNQNSGNNFFKSTAPPSQPKKTDNPPPVNVFLSPVRQTTSTSNWQQEKTPLNHQNSIVDSSMCDEESQSNFTADNKAPMSLNNNGQNNNSFLSGVSSYGNGGGNSTSYPQNGANLSLFGGSNPNNTNLFSNQQSFNSGGQGGQPSNSNFLGSNNNNTNSSFLNMPQGKPQSGMNQIPSFVTDVNKFMMGTAPSEGAINMFMKSPNKNQPSLFGNAPPAPDHKKSHDRDARRRSRKQVRIG